MGARTYYDIFEVREHIKTLQGCGPLQRLGTTVLECTLEVKEKQS